MGHVIIDRRKNDKGKSSLNRRKFIGRVKELLKDGIKGIVRDTNLKDLASGNKKKIKIPVRNLDEPYFHHGEGGINDIVRPGNDRFVPGDKIKRQPTGDGKGSKGSPDGEGEDSFVFHLTKDEFLDLFFENCELPDMMRKALALLTEEELRRSGFVNEGPPSALNIVRSVRQAKSRRVGLRSGRVKKLHELEEREQELIREITARSSQGLDVSVEKDALERVREEIEVARRRVKAVPFIDPVDLRYNNWSMVPIPAVQAVMFCVMDVSGSMDEEKKELAKTFFLMLYLFLQRNYERIEVRYVRYHSRADEVDEKEFYYGTESGGTVTSAGLEVVREIIQNEYPTSLWNIYIAHASDGDNFAHDTPNVKDLLESKLLPQAQYYAYVQVDPGGKPEQAGRGDPDNLINIMTEIGKRHHNVGVGVVTQENQVYPVFLKLFERKAATK
jgi:uncharacterized sporulation protein YeaH/YhbH (DUF444 family)